MRFSCDGKVARRVDLFASRLGWDAAKAGTGAGTIVCGSNGGSMSAPTTVRDP